MGRQDSCDFFHDPAMVSSNAGQVRKTLVIKPHADGSVYFVNLSSQFALPHIMGSDRYTTLPPQRTEGSPSRVDTQLLDLDWDK